MSYKINTTDGRLLVDLVDGRIDTNTTDLTLFGKNYIGYGEQFNENFVRLLENFASVSPPANPLVGQIWYDTSEGRLKVFNGVQFRSSDTTLVSSIEPPMLAGDIWVDTTRRQLYFNDGTSTTLAGPIFSRQQGESGFKVQTIIDRFGNSKIVLFLQIGNGANNQPTTVAIFSKENFTAANNIQNFGREIKTGINLNPLFDNFEFFGPAQSTRNLIDSLNQTFTPDDFLKISTNNKTTGRLHIDNNSGLIVGINSNYTVTVEGANVINRSQIPGSNYRFQIREANQNVDAIFIKSTQRHIGMWNNNPQYSLDVDGDLRITGNLIVQGDTTSLNVENLKVQDKLIEIALPDDSSLLSDAELDGSGISIRSLDGDKTLTWNLLTDAWTSNTNFGVDSGFSFKVGNSSVLSETTLGETVTQSSLTKVDRLENNTNVAGFVFNTAINLNSTLQTQEPLVINSPGNISVPSKIINVVSPAGLTLGVGDAPSTVATKGYVIEVLRNQPVYISVDSALKTSPPYITISDILETIAPAASKNNGVFAYVTLIPAINSTQEILVFKVDSETWEYDDTQNISFSI